MARWVRVTPQRSPGIDLGFKRQAGMRGTGGGQAQAGNLLQRLRQHREHVASVKRRGSTAVEDNQADVPVPAQESREVIHDD